MPRAPKFSCQEELDAAQAAEDAKYVKRTERALRIVAESTWGGRGSRWRYDCPYAVPWMREAWIHAADEWYVAALRRQAARLGVA